MSGFIGGGILGGFSANAVTFDGTNDYLTKSGNLTGISGTREGIVSFWIYISEASLNDTPTILYIGRPADFNPIFQVNLLSDGRVSIFGYESGGANVRLAARTSALDAITVDEWNHVLIAFDLTNSSNRGFYINGEAVTVSPWITYTNAVIAYEQLPANTNAIGANAHQSYSVKLNGDLADVYFDTVYQDITDSAVREKFIRNGRPVKRDSDGGYLGANIPKVWLSGRTDDWHTNKGTGGGFTENGTLTTSANLPVAL